jgi:hypothetical protein
MNFAECRSLLVEYIFERSPEAVSRVAFAAARLLVFLRRHRHEIT